jgi:hypothetical protein
MRESCRRAELLQPDLVVIPGSARARHPHHRDLLAILNVVRHSFVIADLRKLTVDDLQCRSLVGDLPRR